MALTTLHREDELAGLITAHIQAGIAAAIEEVAEPLIEQLHVKVAESVNKRLAKIACELASDYDIRAMEGRVAITVRNLL